MKHDKLRNMPRKQFKIRMMVHSNVHLITLNNTELLYGQNRMKNYRIAKRVCRINKGLKVDAFLISEG